MLYKAKPSYLDGNHKVTIGLRAEDVSIDPEKVKSSKAVVTVKVSHREELGNQTLIYADLNMGEEGIGESSTRVIISTNGEVDCNSGDVVKAALNVEKVHLFDSETEISIIPRIPEYNYVDCKVKGGKLSVLGATISLPEAISCPDGAYELLLPTDAVRMGGDIPVEVVSCENINGKLLTCFTLGGRRLFAVVPEEVKAGAGSISIDFKRISLLSDGKEVVSAMPEKITLGGKLLKEKVKKEIEVNGKTKSKRMIEFSLGLEDAKFPASDYIAQKLVTAMGAVKAFEKPLRYECSPYDIEIVGEGEGISAEVVGKANYGTEVFAICKIGENTLYVKCDNPVEGPVKLVPDTQKLSIIEAELDIKII